MFSASAGLYDLIYTSFKDYPAEAAQVAALIRTHQPGARRILDVACGTAEHARLLVAHHGFEVDALDVDPGFVEIARAKLPGADVYQADMTSFALGRRYDAILCLFSAIGYVRTLENVARTLRCFRAHLAADGVVIVEPWFAPGVIETGRIAALTAEQGGVTVCRMSHAEVAGAISRIRFEYLIGQPGGIERASELHEMGLFTVEELTSCFREAGFASNFETPGLSGRGLHIGRVA